MKCPKCQREHTLRRAENNAVVCAACGSRFPLKTPAKPAAPTTQTPVAPPKSRADLNPQYLDKLIADGKRADAPSQPTANVDDETLSDLLSVVKHIDDAPEAPQNAETTYSLRSEPTPTPPPVSTTQFQDSPFNRRGAAETPNPSTTQASDASAQTSSDENRPSLFSWSGRATQREFLGAVGWYILWSCVAAIFFWFAAGLFSNASKSEELDNPLPLAQLLVTFLLGLASLAGYGAATLFFFAASARRLRDAGLSPYLTLLHFVVSLPLTIFLAVYPGETGKTDAAAQPQTSEKPRPNATQNAPSSFTSAATPSSTATNGWRRFFSWNAPARPTDLPVALGLYALTAAWLVAHLFFEFFFFDAVVEYFGDHDWLDSDAVLGHVVLNFIYLVFLFVRLAIFTLNLTAIGVSILTLAKGTRK